MSGKYKWFHIEYNSAAGQALVEPAGKGKGKIAGGISHKIPRQVYGDYIGTYPEHQVNDVLDKLAGETTYAVFTALGRPPYIEAVDGLSGNYRGSGHHPYSLWGEFDTREEAENQLKMLIEDEDE